MVLTFLRGQADRPRGHAIVFFRVPSQPDQVFATYVVVLPIVVEPLRYLPPAFATQFAGFAGALEGLDAVPLPPVPEPMSFRDATELATRREDDLIDAGLSDGSPMTLMAATQEAVRIYAQSFNAAGGSGESESVSATYSDVPDDDQLRWIFMDDRKRIDEMTALVGRLRDAVSRQDSLSKSDLIERMTKLGRQFPAKYRPIELIAGAQRAGAEGTRLAELYLDRCYRLCNEQYEGLALVDSEIDRLERA